VDPLETAIQWFVAAHLDDSLDASGAFFSLSPASQLLAVHMLRTMHVAFIDASEIDRLDFLADSVKMFRELLGRQPR
jgi:hypothetical protein